MKAVLYAILSKIAPVLSLIAIFSPKITLFLQGVYSANTAANFLWCLTIGGALVFAHCVTSFVYWFDQTPNKLGYYAALVLGSFLAVNVGIGLLMEMLGSTVYYYRYFRFTYFLIVLQVATGFFILVQLYVQGMPQKELDDVARTQGIKC
jgi:hypothetical protein